MKEYGYGVGVYFVTIVTRNREKILSNITCSREDVGAEFIRPGDVGIEVTEIGKIAEEQLLEIPRHYPNVSIETYVMMPDHVHAIIRIDQTGQGDAGRMNSAPTTGGKAGSLPRIMAAYKAGVSRTVHRSLWQRSYYDHVVRSNADYEEIWRYIENNPLRWWLKQSSIFPRNRITCDCS